MAIHWTYDKDCNKSGESSADDDLQQGDILAPTEELRELFSAVHNHFTDDKYLGFMVITQTCDLVRRGNKEKCSARYINLAVIRSMQDVLNDQIKTVCPEIAPGCFRAADKNEAEQLIKRILNQNESKLGLFYLHPDALIGFGEESLALLRVSVAFRATHYDTIRGARTGRLSTEFAHKLGWLVGNLFARVATQDWTESSDRKNTLKQNCSQLLDPVDTPERIWLEKYQIKGCRRAFGSDFTGQTLEAIAEEARRHHPQDFKKAAIDRGLSVIRALGLDLGAEDLARIEAAFAADQAFASYIRKK